MPNEINNENIEHISNNLSEMPTTRYISRTGDIEKKAQPKSFYDLPIELQVRISQKKIDKMDGVTNK